MKLRICKYCGKRIIAERVQTPVQHLCWECGLPQELSERAPEDDQDGDKNSKIIFLDRFR